ncbi:MAG: hypothetical protein BMS9Abin28_2113 [Anaerolineae bacterium]|nr:MAG: hypothetical protein BMS9Abin28_2113 [Anaerolineae bacterium]
MKLILAIIGVLFAVLLAACGGGAPDIELSQTETDLGVITNGEIRTIDVSVQNLGDGDLVIEAVTTSCGCTSAAITPEVIPPGGIGTLAVRYDSGAHGPDEVGSVMRQVFIASNDPSQPEVEFRFTAELISAP